MESSLLNSCLGILVVFFVVEALLWNLRCWIVVVEYVLCSCCGICVVESSLLNSCCGIVVVLLLWNLCCGISVVE